MKYHLVFAELLEEEIQLRGVQADSGSRISGKWKGLLIENREVNQLILWPPIVVVQNTMLDFDDNSKVTRLAFLITCYCTVLCTVIFSFMFCKCLIL